MREAHGLLTDGEPGTFDLIGCDTLDETLECLSTGAIDVMVLLGLSGYELLDLCRRFETKASNVPVFLWIDASDEPMAEEAFARGVVDIFYRGEDSPRRFARAIRYAVWRDQHLQQQRHLVLRAKTVIDHLPELIVFKDNDGRYLMVNHAFERFVQRESSEILGKRDADLFDKWIAENHARSDRLAIDRKGLVRINQAYPKSDGSMRHFEITKVYMPNPDGRGVALVSVSQEVTERKRIEEAFGRERALLRTLIDTLPAAVYIKDTDHRFILTNAVTAEYVGASDRERLIGKTDFDVLPRGRAEEHRRREAELLAGREKLLHYTLSRPDEAGGWRYFHIIKAPFFDSAGNIQGLVGFSLDITEQKRAEQALAESQEQLQFAVEGSEGGIWEMRFHPEDPVGSEPYHVYVSPRMKAFLGFDDDEYPDSMKSFFNRILPEDAARIKQAAEDYIAGRIERYDVEYRIRHRDGSIRWIHSTGKVDRDDQGRRTRWIGIDWDITDRKLAEQALMESQEQLEFAIKGSEGGVWELRFSGDDPPGSEPRSLYFSPRMCAFLGCDENNPPGSLRDFYSRIFSEDVARIQQAAANYIARRTDRYDIEYRVRHSDESIHWIHSTGRATRDEKGRRLRWIGIAWDITERRKAEEALAHSEWEYRMMVDSVPGAIYRCTSGAEYTMLFISDAIEEITGYPPSDFINNAVRTYDSLIHDEDRQRVFATIKQSLYVGEPFVIEYRVIHRDGQIHWVYERGLGYYKVDGNVEWLIGCIVDITERKRIEEERRAYDVQVQHGQKLESLGVLAGGIAHDFNNLLMTILGNADLAMLDLPPTSPVRGHIEQIELASRHAAELCRQMLAYAGRGEFQVQRVQLSELVEEMTYMLEVSISKQAVLKYALRSSLPPIMADVTQLRQVVMNLIVNASEAIGDKSGVIHVTTGAMECDTTYLRETSLDPSLEAGTYVYLEVSDNGCGMDSETKRRLFEPFFSTKFIGRGLGMAAVLGIIRGHNGAIKIYSELGKGSTFKVLLPVATERIEAPESAPVFETDWHGDGTILLVDDEDAVRTVGKLMLERIGFTVLTAENGREAVDCYNENKDAIRCVLLDLTMPHMDGGEAFRELRRIRNDVQVILSSGYSEQDVSQQFAGKGIAAFIQKPYHSQTLIEVLQNVLSRPDNGSEEIPTE